MSLATIISMMTLLVGFIIKMPIGIAMIISTVTYMKLAGLDPSVAIEMICHRMANNYIILAIPLFVFAANIMNEGKITDNIFNFSKAVVGKRRGSLAYVNIIASLIFSGMTGSAVADAAGLGIIEIESMKKDGYSSSFSAAITSASAVIGPIFPPSIPFVIYAMIAEVSLGKMFIAGMAPGVILAIVLMIYIYSIANKRNFPYGTKNTTFRELLTVSLKALPSVLTPVILLLFIYTGITTATEAAAVACVYAVVVSIIVYRSLSPKRFWTIVKDSTKISAQVGIMLAGAYGFAYSLALSGFPKMAGIYVSSLVTSKTMFLILINIFLLFLGAFLETAAIQLLTLPILIPVAQIYGIDLIHFGILFTFNIMIGLCTPPFGMLLFITSGIANEKLSLVIKEVIPLVLFMLFVLVILTFFPQTFMWLPKLLKY
jgi:tripartite ATP-independent transporter DctM subunit